MPAKLLWTPQAREDLLELYRLIGDDQPAAAERMFDRIEGKVRALAAYPHMGARRAEIRPSVRVLIEGNYLIIYECRPDGDNAPVDEVEIVRIIDERRELSKFFR